MTAQDLSGGTYEILRNRLRDGATDLRDRIAKLNSERTSVFGNIETKLLATERLTTDHNCVPRDLASVGSHFLFGYNVQFGLKTETHLNDVFSVYRLDGLQFHHETVNVLLSDARFAVDFAALYRFYKNTTFSRFFASGPFLYMVFQVGKTPADIKTFKWRKTQTGIEYIDNRSEHEVRLPPQHEFEWKRTVREQHHYGKHPHISIEDRVFVETVGGDLTVKVENNTETGAGIYSEPVDNPDQTLDDAEIHYAALGNLILLKIRPYQESKYRFLLFNAKLSTAMRFDEIEHACIMLPEDQGIVFPGGYYLQTGESKRFDHGLRDMRYEQTIPASNGEDYLYLFQNHESGTHVQLRYNLIRQTVETPLITSGQTFFSTGEMVCFKAQEEPQKHHAVQIWQTPFTGPDYVPQSKSDSLLFKIGNKDLVRGMSECSEILLLIDKNDNYDGLYVDLVKRTSDILDSYFWIDKPETLQLNQPLVAIREAASAAVEEFEKVVRLRRDTATRTQAVKESIETLGKEIERSRFESIDEFVAALSKLRDQRGQAIGLRELRYVDLALVESMEKSTAERSERLSRRCVDFLITPGALDPYRLRVDQAGERVALIAKVSDAKDLQKAIDESSTQLELLTDTVSNLKIDDATKRTEIIDSISVVFSSLNRVRSSLKARTNDLIGTEGRAEFASQLKLLEQTVSGYLDVCDSPEKCDSYLTRVMIQLEELEGRFADFEEFIERLSQRREEVYQAFETRKVQLVEARNRKAESLASSASRILNGIHSKASTFKTVDEILAYFASDLMVEKVRNIVEQLRGLEDAVRVEEIQSRLKTTREEVIRQLKDRQELFEDSGDTIRLGRHKFAVNRQPLELTTVVRDNELCLHLTGTQYFEPLHDADLLAAKDLWDQELISENSHVYRSEYLAADLLATISTGASITIDSAYVQSMIGNRFSEGYAKGVHDHDAALILSAMDSFHRKLGLLRHSPTVRTAATLWWQRVLPKSNRNALASWLGGFAKLATAFPNAQPAKEFRNRIRELVSEADDLLVLFDRNVAELPVSISTYLFEMLTTAPFLPVYSRQAVALYESFIQSLADKRSAVTEAIKSNDTRPLDSFVLARNWSDAFIETQSEKAASLEPLSNYRDELAWLIQQGGSADGVIVEGSTAIRLNGLTGSHSRISSGAMTVSYHELKDRLADYRRDVVPRFNKLVETKHRLLEAARHDMRLEEFKPKVLTSFVRNRLIDEVYLPMIGDNLAKQMGAAGEGKRTDRMGLLLLISPPGYGKTTLMEYVANRLGVVFMKINGPAIGHGVTSLDPSEAPNAAAREEIERLNLALEMGDNMMLYLDDIQHTNPELLQKFISLCDATRKIEGVRKGRTRTFDLRGRRVAVVMAGNPYTESGERFQIPDMLSNRADVYNLGEIIGGATDAFEMSYLENCLTSNEVLAPLAAGDPKDAREMLRAAQRDSIEGIDLKGNYSVDVIRSMFEVIRKLLRVRDVVLKVNRAYIRSAAQADAYRTEPPFKLQGSYRNMNRMAEKVVPVMNDAELQALVLGSYEQDAQTLTTDNEANLLKLKELLAIQTPAEKERWESIKYAFVENVRMAGVGTEDQAGQLLRQLASMRDGLESIRQVIGKAVAVGNETGEQRMDDRLELIRESVQTASDRIAGVLESTSTQLQAISRQQALSPPEQSVLVQHKVPRVMLDLIKGQFFLMQEWMRPLLANSTNQGQELNQLKSRLESLMKIYVEMQKDLESAEES